MRNILSFLLEISKIVIIALVIVLPIRYFLFQPFIVRGASMEPSFYSGDYLIIDEFSYRFSNPERGEVIVFKNPKNLSQKFIKRIIGLPEETIQINDGRVIIFQDDETQVLDESSYISEFIETPGDITISLAENEYFVLGDNRFASSDSRRWGVLPRKNIIGIVFFRAWPFSALAKVEAPIYLNQ